MKTRLYPAKTFFFYAVIVVSMLQVMSASGNNFNTDTLETDGAWCWFADPRAIYFKGEKEQTYFSWVNSEGDIEVASYNHQTGAMVKSTLYERLQVDDHDNPSIYIREDRRIVVFFSKHTTGPMHRMISDNPEDITSFGGDYTFGTDVTYPYPFKVGNELLLFYRGINWHPTLVVSADSGQTFGAPRQFVKGGGARPYTRYCTDKNESIHIASTTGHPRNEANNKIYYACYKNGKFYKADGSLIKEYTGEPTALDIDNNEAETVYDASNGKGWIWDITTDENGYPVMVYAVFPNDQDHRYYYSRWDGAKWNTAELTKGGKWFPQTPAGANEPEPNYSGGISLDYDNPDVVYLSKPVNGVFEIWKWFTHDQGETWDSLAITSNTPPGILNVRPIVPRHHKPGYFDILWMRGTYIHYTNYNTSIVYVSNQQNEKVFDFGPESSVHEAANPVTDKTLYIDDYGFTDTSGLYVADQQKGDFLQRDFIWGSKNKTFKVDLLNGEYKVTIAQCDTLTNHDQLNIYANGETVLENLDIVAGDCTANSFNVEVNDGSLQLGFEDGGGVDTNWIINSIKIETIGISPDSVLLDQDTVELYIGGAVKVVSQIYPFLATNKNIDWESNLPDVATVENGVVTAISPGQANITASLDSGRVKNTCTVVVKEPVYLDSAFFDFGTSSSILAKGAIRITETSMLNESYGFDDISGLVSRDRSISDPELRDLIFSSATKTFKVYLKNGTYPVVINQGDASFSHDNMTVYANGVEVISSVSATTGNFVTTKFEVTVTKGVLDLMFVDEGGSDANWVVNSIKIGMYEAPPVGINKLDDVFQSDFPVKASVIDISGKVICDGQKIIQSKNDIPCYQALPLGIYFLTVGHSDQMRTIRFFKD